MSVRVSIVINLSGIYHSALIPGSRLKIGMQESRFGLKIY